MATQTGRSVSKWVKVQIKDPTTLRDIPVDSISGLGISFDEQDIVAWQDAVKGAQPNLANCKITITGPLDTTAAVAASSSTQHAALSGSHVVLQPLNGASTPLTFAIYCGIRHDWETGEPVFGLSNTVATNGFVVTSYIADWANAKYTATLRVAAGSAAPAWGTAALT